MQQIDFTALDEADTAEYLAHAANESADLLSQIAATIRASEAAKQARVLSMRDVLGYEPCNRHERRFAAKLLRQAKRRR